MEGATCFRPETNCNDGSLTLPVAQYSHNYGCAIIGGYVYRGTQYKRLYGSYIFADYCSGRIWQLKRNLNAKWTTSVLAKTNFNISSFGEDKNGELYIIHRDENKGSIHRIILK